MDTSRRFSFRFWLCNLIFGDALRRAMAFGMIRLEDTLKYNIYGSRLDGYWYGGLYVVFDDLLRIAYGIDHRSAKYSKEGLIVNKMKRRFRICNLLYFGSLLSELDSVIGVLYALTSYLKVNGFIYDETCSVAIRCIIRSFDVIMYRQSRRRD